MKRKIKFSIIFTISFFVAGLVVGAVLVSYSGYSYNGFLIKQTEKYTEDVAESSASQVNIFLKGKKERAVDFASDGFIKNRLKALKANPSEEIMQGLSEHLIKNKIVVDESFYEVSVLDVFGKVVGTTNPKKEFGKDFSQDLIFLEGKNSPYVRESFYDEEFLRDGITLSSPVLREGEFVGVIIIKMSLEKLTEIVVRAGNFEEYGQVYLIDSNSLMATPSKFLRGENKGVLTQTVDTKNSRECIESIQAYGSDVGKFIEHSEKNIFPFLDYRGEEVLGTHRHIIEASWCLLVEIDKEKRLATPLKTFVKNQIIVFALILMFLTLVGFIVGRFLNKKYKI